MKKGDIIIVYYATEERLAQIVRIDHMWSKIKIVVKFTDNGEERRYTLDKFNKNRINIAKPTDIVRCRTK